MSIERSFYKDKAILAKAWRPAEKMEAEVALNRLLDNLSDEDKELIEGRLKGFSYKEISELLEITPAACRKRLQRIKERVEA